MSKKEKAKSENITEEAVITDIPENIEEAASDNIDSEAEKLTLELASEKDKYIRLMAEYDNFRKRSAKEKLESYGDAAAKLLSEILPVFDNFERALSSECADENFKKGMEMIFNQFSDYLKKQGIEVIDPLGEEFNPETAQAINQTEDENLGENTVAQVFQKGYKLGEKIIRYAMVVVANP
ncbi:MAG: nucleotide exchange factor GrpE [Oscillospiraceae bacterium]|jgi:molecular chaperone GrpE